jgi:hypothetical protein
MEHTEERNPPPPSQGLDYAARLPPNARKSKLAVVALAASILACPQLFVFLGKRFDQFARVDSLRLRLAAMSVATALATVALLRVRLSRGTLLGAGMASAGLAISLLWWLLMALVFLMFMSWGGPR